MKKIALGIVSLSIILSSSVYAKSTFRYKSSSKIGYYCTKINPTEQACKQYIEYRSKLKNVSITIRKEIKQYCKTHPKDVILCRKNFEKPKKRTLGFQ